MLPAAKSALLNNHKHKNEWLHSKNDALTLIINGGHEEVTIHCLGHCSQRVTGLQSVVAIVDVCWGLEGQTALQIVLVEVHLSSNVVVLQNLLLLVEPAQLGMGVTPNRELDAGIVAFLGLSQSQDDWRDCRETEKKSYNLHDILGILTLHPKHEGKSRISGPWVNQKFSFLS